MLGIGIGSVLFAYAAFASVNSGAAYNKTMPIRQAIFESTYAPVYYNRDSER